MFSRMWNFVRRSFMLLRDVSDGCELIRCSQCSLMYFFGSRSNPLVLKLRSVKKTMFSFLLVISCRLCFPIKLKYSSYFVIGSYSCANISYNSSLTSSSIFYVGACIFILLNQYSSKIWPLWKSLCKINLKNPTLVRHLLIHVGR